MVRFVITALFLGLFLLFSYLLFVMEWVIGKFNPKARDISSLRIVQWAFKVIARLSGVKLTVIGEENIPDEPVLYIGNHRSFFDVVLTYSRCRRLTGYIAKDNFEKIPSLSNWMHRLYCLFLNRDDVREGLKTILTAIDYIKNGISIFVFPEGTRNRGEELSLLPFHDGAFKIATKTGCAIVPVSINNTIQIFEAHFPKLKKTHVIIEYGQPIYPNELDKETKRHIGDYVKNIIDETIHKNAELV